MALETEAACLLRTGAQYGRRCGLRRAEGLAFAGLKRGAFSLYFGDDPIFHYDRQGRWQRIFADGVHYRKSLDNAVDAIDRVRVDASMELRRRSVPFAEAADLDATARNVALELLDAVYRGEAEVVAPPEGVAAIGPDELRSTLEAIVGWDAARWFVHREKYLKAYGPIGFLPPDCHASIVVQSTLGDACGWAFGGASPREHAVRTPEEFARHCRDVAALWGRRATQAKGIYLAGGDALCRPAEEVEATLRALSEVFPMAEGDGPRRLRDLPEDLPRFEGVDGWIDDLGGPMVDAEGWSHLQASGLRRVNLGVESGDSAIRSIVGRNWDDDRARRLVGGLKSGGIAVRVVALVGAGGVERAREHVAGTIGLIESLGLARGDLVYLVAAADVGDPTQGGRFTGLDQASTEVQRTAIKAGLAETRDRGAKVVVYSTDKQMV